VRRLHGLGFCGVELMGDLDTTLAAEASQAVLDLGLAVLSITPADMYGGQSVDLAHPNPAVRSASVDYYVRLLEFAAELGLRQPGTRTPPLVGCHGYVGRVRAIGTLAQERAVFVEAVQKVADRARPMGLRVVLEVLNRYEAHLNCTAAETVRFVADVGSECVGILLDAYHMNIEEAEPAAAIRQAGERLWLYHVADSNRQGIGRGHTDFRAQLAALSDVGYAGPIILECTAPGPDPFSPIKGPDSLAWLETYLRESREWLAGAALSP
jgi:sugar phosphate isomerase/epimerase